MRADKKEMAPEGHLSNPDLLVKTDLLQNQSSTLKNFKGTALTVVAATLEIAPAYFTDIYR
jgi:hypothetical protein